MPTPRCGGAYIATLCRRLGVDDFDALWDEMFEVEPGMSVEEYFRRGHAFCEHLAGSTANRRRSTCIARRSWRRRSAGRWKSTKAACSS